MFRPLLLKLRFLVGISCAISAITFFENAHARDVEINISVSSVSGNNATFTMTPCCYQPHNLPLFRGASQAGNTFTSNYTLNITVPDVGFGWYTPCVEISNPSEAIRVTDFGSGAVFQGRTRRSPQNQPHNPNPMEIQAGQTNIFHFIGTNITIFGLH